MFPELGLNVECVGLQVNNFVSLNIKLREKWCSKNKTALNINALKFSSKTQRLDLKKLSVIF